MITEENPFEFLALDPTARRVEIRGRYLRRMHRIDPDEEPEAFLRLRRAMHLALARSPGNRRAAGEPEETPGANARGRMVAQLNEALRRGDTTRGLELASTGPWHDALSDEDPLAIEATVRLGCATVWAAPDLYEQVWLQHSDILREHGLGHAGGLLPFMHDQAQELAAWSTLREPAPWLASFLEAGIVPSERHRRLARAMLPVVTGDPAAILRDLAHLDEHLPEVIAFLGQLARELPYEMGEQVPLETSARDRAAALRAAFPVLRGALLIPAALGLAVLTRRPGPVLAGAGATALFSGHIHDEWYRRLLRPRLLRTCLEHSVAPFDVGAWARTEPAWSRARPFAAALVADGVLQTAYDMARLVRALAT